MAILKNDWLPLLEKEFEQPYYLQLRQFLIREYETKVIYPAEEDIFTALQLTSYANTNVVILGQDPYHGPGQAHGLSFSVKTGVKPPPSLLNIFKELQTDLGCSIPNNGYLAKWAGHGVLLLNAVLTVRQGEANSHRGKGWEIFTNKVISLINEREQPAVFILWGNHAQEKLPLIDQNKHFIIKSAHPSPFSAHRGFFGSKPFSQANEYLRQIGSAPIDWQIPNISS
jgi:uracil-DNA glycosylase